eukprot:Clim_evm14s157 gene=Clim_evmTU14s157
MALQVTVKVAVLGPDPQRGVRLGTALLDRSKSEPMLKATVHPIVEIYDSLRDSNGEEGSNHTDEIYYVIIGQLWCRDICQRLGNEMFLLPTEAHSMNRTFVYFDRIIEDDPYHDAEDPDCLWDTMTEIGLHHLYRGTVCLGTETHVAALAHSILATIKRTHDLETQPSSIPGMLLYCPPFLGASKQ